MTGAGGRMVAGEHRWQERFEKRFGPIGVPPVELQPAKRVPLPLVLNPQVFLQKIIFHRPPYWAVFIKIYLSKNFKGGDITIFMGGAELNLSQADIQGTAALDITQIMGGTKIVVPPHWTIRSELTSVFGSIEDKRQNIGIPNPEKVLIIDGTSVFGGIEIRNY